MISIIVPVYNMEKYLTQCVSSLINQNYKDVEIILVDDGSTDASPQMCDEFAKQDDRIKVIHKTNGGQGSARNMGLDIANGEYISFIDSDDWVDINMYTHLLSVSEKYDADLVVCEVAWNEEDGTVRVNKRVDGILVMSTEEAMEHYFDGSNIVPHGPCSKLYRRYLFDDLRFPENRLLEDTAIAYKIVDRAKCVVTTDTVGYNIRCDMGSVSRRKYNQRRCDTIITYTELSDFLSANEKYKKYIPIANGFIAGAIFYNAGEAYCSDLENKNEVMSRIRQYAKDALKSNKRFSLKNNVLLHLIATSPTVFGMFYKVAKHK